MNSQDCGHLGHAPFSVGGQQRDVGAQRVAAVHQREGQVLASVGFHGIEIPSHVHGPFKIQSAVGVEQDVRLKFKVSVVAQHFLRGQGRDLRIVMHLHIQGPGVLAGQRAKVRHRCEVERGGEAHWIVLGMKRPDFTPWHGPQHVSRRVAGLLVGVSSERPCEGHERCTGQHACPIVAGADAQVGVAGSDPWQRVDLDGVGVSRCACAQSVRQGQSHVHLAWFQSRRPSCRGDGHPGQQIAQRVCGGHGGQHLACVICGLPCVAVGLRVQRGVELGRLHAEEDTLTRTGPNCGTLPAHRSRNGKGQHVKGHVS